MSLMFQPLKKYADFSGRARRSEYWLFTLFIVLVEIAYFILVSAIGGGTSGNMNPIGMVLSGLYFLFVLGILIPSLAVSFRRLHHANRSALRPLTRRRAPPPGSARLSFQARLDPSP